MIFGPSDFSPLIWYHVGAISRFTREEEKLFKLEVLLENLKHHKAHINDIMVGLEQFGAVWQFV